MVTNTRYNLSLQELYVSFQIVIPMTNKKSEFHNHNTDPKAKQADDKKNYQSIHFEVLCCNFYPVQCKL